MLIGGDDDSDPPRISIDRHPPINRIAVRQDGGRWIPLIAISRSTRLR